LVSKYYSHSFDAWPVKAELIQEQRALSLLDGTSRLGPERQRKLDFKEEFLDEDVEFQNASKP